MPEEQITPTPPEQQTKPNRLPVLALSIVSLILIALVGVQSYRLMQIEQPTEPVQIVVSDEVVEEMEEDAEEMMEEEEEEMEEESPVLTGGSFSIFSNVKTNTSHEVTEGLGETFLFKKFDFQNLDDDCTRLGGLYENSLSFGATKEEFGNSLARNLVLEQLDGQEDRYHQFERYWRDGWLLSSTCRFDDHFFAAFFDETYYGTLTIMSSQVTDERLDFDLYSVKQPFDGIFLLTDDSVPGEVLYYTGYGDAGVMTWSVERLDVESGASDLIEQCLSEPSDYDDYEADRVLRCEREYMPQ